jgi:hypothetical protein
MEAFSFTTPIKPHKMAPIQLVTKDDNDLEASRKKFDLLESKCLFFFSSHVLIIIDEEPLLKDSKCRFVLFPIQYHEVSAPAHFHLSLTNIVLDLANV